MNTKKSLIRKRVKVTSDNENYNDFANKTLVITHAGVGGRGYDDSCYPEALCSFTDIKGNPIPCSLYEYEFAIVK